MIPEKTVAQQEIEGFKIEKVGLHSISIKSFKAWDFQFDNRFSFFRARISIAFAANADGTKKNSSLFYWEIKKTSLFRAQVWRAARFLPEEQQECLDDWCSVSEVVKEIRQRDEGK